MSSEGPIEGVLANVTQGPLSDISEAQELMSRAWAALRIGAESLSQGRELLALAEQRQAWKILGFASWHECVIAGIGDHLRTSLRPEARAELAIQFRTQQSLPTRAIADALGVTNSTIARDLIGARKDGRLTPDQDKVVTADGRVYRGDRDGAEPIRRPSFQRTWLRAVDELRRQSKRIETLRYDDRLSKHIDNIWGTKSDIERAVDVLLEVLEALEKQGPSHAEGESNS